MAAAIIEIDAVRICSTAERMFRSDLADHVADLVHRSMARTADRFATATA